eukprot:m.12807 g.12807  ORF g.12807 m.12807 type:complete len:61 (-) comp9459_c0_seq1:8-190(-)
MIKLIFRMHATGVDVRIFDKQNCAYGVGLAGIINALECGYDLKTGDDSFEVGKDGGAVVT